ncbi:hypothetical protein HYPSUDRAFT_37175 [Hypholoma sublateritium FD-334 SS-4]|uniref:Auxin efflux carrier n=1 Tax=Hypholoma sublateritium (strain FD-334 SS-4) TaxID=945553 RepID=A0A0D2LE65_HYPSF|nr:hypothetical protein HYPSUDRAFT_37175 [Hypholoma sublateritium FD-334 SS-4]
MEVGSLGGRANTPFSDLLLAVFNSILEVFIICAAGYILARQGILDKRTQKQINRLNVSLFTPALLFSKVAFYLTPEKLKELWVIPIWFVIVTTASMAVGRLLGWIFGLRRSQRSFVMAAAMFMNSNALPIALMQSLVVSVPDLAWGSDDNKNAMLGRALTYLTMYSTLGMVVRYSYGVSLLSRADTILSASTTVVVSEHDDHEQTPLLDAPEPLGASDDEIIRSHPSSSTLTGFSSHNKLSTSTTSSSNSGNCSPRIMGSPPPMSSHLLPGPETVTLELHCEDTLQRPSSKRKNTTFYNSFPNSPNESRQELPTYDDDLSADEEDAPGHQSGHSHSQVDADALPTHHHERDAHSSARHAVYRLLHRLSRPWVAFVTFMTVPLWAAIASLFVACFDPVKHALEVHMTPLNEAISVAGKCAVPLTLVVLGAYFYVPEPEDDRSGIATSLPRRKKTAKQAWFQKLRNIIRSASSYGSDVSWGNADATRPKETITVALAVAARMLITPAVLLPFIMLATKSDWHAVFEDPVFVVVNTILLCSPPALTLAQITAAVSGDAFERLISRTIFWSYCIMTPPVTIGCVLLGLWLAKA